MTNEDKRPEEGVSNWTLATGTRPGERQVYPIMSQRTASGSDAEAK
jgi:hypothetical protein